MPPSTVIGACHETLQLSICLFRICLLTPIAAFHVHIPTYSSSPGSCSWNTHSVNRVSHPLLLLLLLLLRNSVGVMAYLNSSFEPIITPQDLRRESHGYLRHRYKPSICLCDGTVQYERASVIQSLTKPRTQGDEFRAPTTYI